jgi:hypothetical protein
VKNFVNEVDENFATFSAGWPAEREASVTVLGSQVDKYKSSYRRLVSLQAWRSSLLEQSLSPESLAFFLEAQNDGLVSHVLARSGSWRAALKALRSLIENTCFCLYYMDHPVELELWLSGAHRIGFRALSDYFEHHPRIGGVSPADSGIDVLRNEYSTLSKAVHASASGFRMTSGMSTTQLWSADPARLGAWLTREGQVLLGVNLLLMAVFRERIAGTALPQLRYAISLAVGASRYTRLKTLHGVSLSRH